MNTYTLALIVGSYLLGAVPFGLLICWFSNSPDPRSGGSRNIGATNVSRMAGKLAGAATLVLDVAKGFVPCALALDWFDPWVAAAAGLAALVGHCWPIYLGFKGGKGVATAIGVFLAASMWAGLVVLAVIGLVAWLTGHMSLGSILGSGTAPLWLWLTGSPFPFVVMAVCMATLIIYRHKENIGRLRAGQEIGWH